MTPRQPKVPAKADDKEQSEQFIKTAQKYGTDKSSKDFERAFKKVVPPRPKSK